MAQDALVSGKQQESGLGDRYPVRPAPQELEAMTAVSPFDE